MEKYFLAPPSDNNPSLDKLFAGKMTKTTNPVQADYIVFGGGPDVNPKLYGESKHRLTNTNSSRDDLETNLYKAYKHKKFIGICRGAQLGHVLSGGFLVQDTDRHRQDHLMTVGSSSYMVTSTHHQMMADPTAGHVLGICNRSTYKYKDNITDIQKKLPYDIEIMYHPKTRFLCFQPHPEFNHAHKTRQIFFELIKKVF